MVPSAPTLRQAGRAGKAHADGASHAVTRAARAAAQLDACTADHRDRPGSRQTYYLAQAHLEAGNHSDALTHYAARASWPTTATTPDPNAHERAHAALLALRLATDLHHHDATAIVGHAHALADQPTHPTPAALAALIHAYRAADLTDAAIAIAHITVGRLEPPTHTPAHFAASTDRAEALLAAAHTLRRADPHTARAAAQLAADDPHATPAHIALSRMILAGG